MMPGAEKHRQLTRLPRATGTLALTATESTHFGSASTRYKISIPCFVAISISATSAWRRYWSK